jgi:hypothetical protein
MPKICLVVYRATAGGAVLAVLLSSFQDVLQDGRKKSLLLLQSEDDMIFFVGQISKSRSYFPFCLGCFVVPHNRY